VREREKELEKLGDQDLLNYQIVSVFVQLDQQRGK